MINRSRDILKLGRDGPQLRKWERAARGAGDLDLAQLRKLRTDARKLRRHIDEVIHVADGRLALPRIGSNAISRPAQSDWAFRPEIWRGPIRPNGIAAAKNGDRIGQAATLHHDCKISELTLRQIRNTREDDLAPFGLRLDVFKFDGSFLSLVIDLSDDAVQGLRRIHILRLEANVETEKPLEIFARLNIKYGPNVEQVVRELSGRTAPLVAEFDLAHTKVNEARIERVWVDLIFEEPEMNEISLRDLTFSRRPRADF